MTFYAHSHPEFPRDKSKWQPLEEHLRNVAEKAKGFAESFGAGEWAWDVGWLHDLGKAADEFQAYLLRQNGLDDSEYDGSGNGRVNHSGAGAAYAEDTLSGVPGRTLAYLVAGHHAGLPDWFPDRTGNAALHIRLGEGREDLDRIRGQVSALLTPVSPTQKPTGVNPSNYHLWVRMLYSCLVDADFLDTEAFMQANQTSARTGFSGIRALKEKFDRHMETAVRRGSRRSRWGEEKTAR